MRGKQQRIKYLEQQLKALKGETVKKVKPQPMKELKKFMAGHGYTVENVQKTKYNRKDGKVIEAQKVTFSNGKDYMVSSTRFWKIK